MKRSIPVLALTFLLAVCWMLAAQADPESQIDPSRRLGPAMQVENLTVWPVISDAPVETGEILSLHDAIEKGLAQVREKGAGNDDGRHQQRRGDSATVNQLVIENRGDRPILVTAGTIVKGGKQDRQLGQDLVVDARSTVPIDAFCVERGRWTEQREGKSTGGVFEVPKVKAAKRVRAAGHYEKNQSEVWSQVDKVNRKADNDPATSTFLATAEDGDEKAQDVRRRLATTVKRHFAGLDAEDEGTGEVVGFAYSVNGEPLGLRTFANRALFEAHFEPFVETMSLEAQVTQFRDRRAGRESFDRTASSEALLTLVRGINEAKVEVHATSGLNSNNTRSNEWGGRSTALIQGEDGMVPVTEDWTAASELQGKAREILLRLRALGYSRE